MRYSEVPTNDVPIADGTTNQLHRRADANGTTYQLSDFAGWVASAAVQGALWRDDEFGSVGRS
jgi:hypothetical protein